MHEKHFKSSLLSYLLHLSSSISKPDSWCIPREAGETRAPADGYLSQPGRAEGSWAERAAAPCPRALAGRGACAGDARAVRLQLPSDGRRPIARCFQQEAGLQVGERSAPQRRVSVCLGAGCRAKNARRGWRRPRGAAGRKRRGRAGLAGRLLPSRCPKVAGRRVWRGAASPPFRGSRRAPGSACSSPALGDPQGFYFNFILFKGTGQRFIRAVRGQGNSLVFQPNYWYWKGGR